VARCSKESGVRLVSVPLAKDYSHPLDAMAAGARSSAGLVYICNPNNPTGTLTRRQDIEAFLRSLPASVYVLVDEAYHHYVSDSADYASFIDRPIDDARIIVIRSFSKMYGLAGLRIGYGIASADTVRRLARHQLGAEVNVLAARAASGALDDLEHLAVSAARNADARQEFFNQANARMLRVIDSHTNFVMLNVGRPAAPVVEHYRAHHIVLPVPFAGFETHLRVSLGTEPEMRECWRVWDLLPMHAMSM
jgi:histidinol-phosphate aminotransferase